LATEIQQRGQLRVCHNARNWQPGGIADQKQAPANLPGISGTRPDAPVKQLPEHFAGTVILDLILVGTSIKGWVPTL
jgi:hypothetical protein